MMLEDLDYTENIQNLINEDRLCAEYAVFETGKVFSKTFADMDDDYMKARSVDVHAGYPKRCARWLDLTYLLL